MLSMLHVATGEVHLIGDDDGYDPNEWHWLPPMPNDRPDRWRWLDGEWVPDTTAAMTLLRAERDRRLLATDFPPVFELPQDRQTPMKDYRQALRELPETVDPFNPEWPIAPE